jgi:rubrerythrin
MHSQENPKQTEGKKIKIKKSRYTYFAQKADIEGKNDVAAVFRSTANGETGHALGHLEFLEKGGFGGLCVFF